MGCGEADRKSGKDDNRDHTDGKDRRNETGEQGGRRSDHVGSSAG